LHESVEGPEPDDVHHSILKKLCAFVIVVAIIRILTLFSDVGAESMLLQYPKADKPRSVSEVAHDLGSSANIHALVRWK
jgi:hypothetical protein